MTRLLPPPRAEGAHDRALDALFLLFAIAAPWSIAGAESAVVAAALVLLFRRGYRTRLPLPLWFVGLFLLLQALSIPLGVHPERSLRCFRGSWVLLFPFVFWAGLHSRTTRRRVILALVVSGALAGAYGFWQHIAGLDLLHGRRLENYGGGGYVAVGNLNSHLTYAGVLLPILFLALGLLAGGARRLAAIASLFLGLGIAMSFTRTAWIGAALGVATFGLLRGRRVAALLLGTLLALVAGMVLLEPAMARRLGSIFQSHDDPRWRLWQTALRISADHPWLGAGLGSFKTLFSSYRVPGAYMSTVHPHHDLLNVVVETGVLGGAAWLAIWISFLRQALRSPGGRSPLLDGAIAGVVALLAAGLGQCYSTDEEVAEVWWFVVAIGLHEAQAPAVLPFRLAVKKLKAASLPIAVRLLGSSGTAPAGEPRRVLVIRPDNRLGNLLLLAPFLRRLREALPRAEITLLAGDEYAPLVGPWPWIDRLWVQEKRLHAREPWRFPSWIAGLKRGRFDWAFEMSNHNTHSYYSCLLTAASGAPVRIGFDEPRNASTLTVKVPAPESTLHFSLAPLSLLRALGLPAEPLSLDCPRAPEVSPAFAAWRAREGLGGNEGVVVHLGGRDAKAWPLGAWELLLPRLLDTTEERVLLVAGHEERARLRSLSVHARGRIVEVPPLGVTDLAHLLAGARGFVGCDSGVLHLAVAAGSRVTALFFRSNPYHYAPLGIEHRTVLLANPYGVEDEVWRAPVGGMARSLLVRADGSGEDARRGIPATDARAAERVAEAAAGALRALHEGSAC